jgi:NAD(P)-dependent dehydrogenase (short-subunit alcohol dehydrogenase family)
LLTPARLAMASMCSPAKPSSATTARAGASTAWRARSLRGRPGRLDAAVERLDGQVTAVAVDAEQADSLREFFARAGPITDLVITVTRRGAVGPVAQLAEADLLGAFAGKTVAHLRAVGLGSAHLGRKRFDHASDGRFRSICTARHGRTGGGQRGARGSGRPTRGRAGTRRVNAVSPGVIETQWWDELPGEARQETFATFAQRALVRRNGQPEDVAQAIVAVIGNGFITGVVLPCDGGLRLT